jgi:hypothetical protein
MDKDGSFSQPSRLPPAFLSPRVVILDGRVIHLVGPAVHHWGIRSDIDTEEFVRSRSYEEKAMVQLLRQSRHMTAAKAKRQRKAAELDNLLF